MSKTRKLAFLSLFGAVALILSYVESLLPPLYPAVPGIKMGIANIAVIMCLYVFSPKEAFFVSLIKVFMGNLLFGSPMSLIYSFLGAMLSLGAMILLKKTNAFSLLGVSVAGAVFHNLGQILVAMVVLRSIYVGYYMTVLSVTAVVAGVFTGLAAAVLAKRIEKYLKG